MREDSMSSDDIDDNGPCSHKTASSNRQILFRGMETVCPTWAQKVVFVEDE